MSVSARALVPCVRVVEEQSFADGLARAERGEADRAAIELLLDGDRAAHDDREELPLGALGEEQRVALVLAPA